MVQVKVWMPNNDSKAGGSFKEVSRIAIGDSYCGIRTLQVINETPQKGEENWEKIPPPPD